MRKRLYFLLPDIKETHQVVNELLLARIDEGHLHVLARDDIDLEDLPEANILQKSDIVHGVESGIAIGGILGLLSSVVFITVLRPEPSMMGLIVLGCTLFGALFGVWTAGMIGSSTKNTRLKEFEQPLAEGKILLMADVPKDKIMDIQHIIEAHKHAVSGGEDPSIPAFP